MTTTTGTYDRHRSLASAKGARDAHELETGERLVLWHGRHRQATPTGLHGRARVALDQNMIRECWRLTQGEEPRDPQFRWEVVG